jgi:hypothetical protein
MDVSIKGLPFDRVTGLQGKNFPFEFKTRANSVIRCRQCDRRPVLAACEPRYRVFRYKSLNTLTVKYKRPLMQGSPPGVVASVPLLILTRENHCFEGKGIRVLSARMPNFHS